METLLPLLKALHHERRMQMFNSCGCSVNLQFRTPKQQAKGGSDLAEGMGLQKVVCFLKINPQGFLDY